MSNVSSVTNHFPTVNEGFITTVAGSTVSSGGTSVSLASVSGLINGSVFVGIIEPGEANQQVFTGTVDTGGTQIVDVVWTRGSNAAHPIGSTVVDYVTGTAINMITKGILTFANQDGTLKAITAPSATLSGSLSVSGTSTLAATSVSDLTVTGFVKYGSATVVSSGSITPTATNYAVTALAVPATINVPAPTTNGTSLTLRIKDDGTARALTWGSGYQAIGVTLPTTTVAGKFLYVSAIYNSQSSEWDVLSIGRET